VKHVRSKNAPPKIPFGLISTVLLALILLLQLIQSCNSAPVEQGGPTTHAGSTVPSTTVKKNEGSISIPGFELLELQADSREQTICLSNPAQNNCYFEISLFLEDGTLLWRSELIGPGEITKPLQLSSPLAKGYYPGSLLRYRCFRMDEALSPLNGADTKVTLWVK